MRRWALAMLLMVATQNSTEETGLSKGPADPADLGTRCSVMAGREDRAYLDCGMQAPKASTPGSVTPPERPRIDDSGGGRDGTGRRYPLRSR
jgi:hypothetical protein